jgi:uncharacterized phage protein (TIGR02218 family)
MGIADGELTSIALCWRLERTDGAGVALTSCDEPLMSEDIMYEPVPGITPGSVTRSLGLDPHSGEVGGALSADSLDAADLATGRWDATQVRLTAVDWTDPGANPVQLVAGELGNVSIDGESFSAELRGASVKLDDPVCPATSAECRADFGDKQCRVDLAGRTIRATVVTSNAGELTLDTAVDDRFILGRLRFMSGVNCGLTSVILSASGSVAQLRDIPRAAVENGCAVELREGCDKTFQTCVSRFANAANFRGEPYLPGSDLLTRYPGA